MGRFETTADFYRYREPYPPKFFEAVAARVGMTQQTRLLDVGTGPGVLAIGFAPFAKTCTAIDRESAMLRVARAAAAKRKLDNGLHQIRFIQVGIEDLDYGPSSFDFLTIGRALHWLPREATLRVFAQIVAPGGCIAICGSTATDACVQTWASKFNEVRRTWASGTNQSLYKIDMNQWFSDSRFRKMDEIAVKHRHRVSVAELVARALSFSSTSSAALGERRPQFEAEIQAALEPSAEAGMLEEEVLAKATIFR
jgi:ubiquinone/menaquinone biosynthesis C-methylase UbiE